MNERESGKKRTYEENSKFILDRIQEALGEYQNKSGGEDPLHICVLFDCRRFVLKANEEIQKLRDDIEVKDLEKKRYHQLWQMCLDEKIHKKYDKTTLDEGRVVEIHIDKQFYEECQYEMKQASLKGAQELATRIKSYLNIGRPGEEELVSFDDIEFLIKEMKEEML